MAAYLISYDLRKPEFDYKPLYFALHAIEAKNSITALKDI